MGWYPYETDPHSEVIRSELIIGGVKVYAFGLENVSPPAEGMTKKVAALILLHGRTNNHLLTDSIGHIIVDSRLKTKPEAEYPLVAFSIDLPNHGERALNLSLNMPAPADPLEYVNFVSCMDAGVKDVKNILEFLPGFFPEYEFDPYVLGTSMGGHMAFRLVPEISMKGLINIVGAPDQASLLYHRGMGSPLEKYTNDIYRKSYEELEIPEHMKRKYPKMLHDNLSLAARRYYEIADSVPALLISGESDNVVNSTFVSELQAKEGAPGFDIEVYTEPVGHTTTLTMIEKVKEWLFTRLDAVLQ